MTRVRSRRELLWCLVTTLPLFVAPAVRAQQTGELGGASLPSAIDGSPAPMAPATITRDALGRATVRAIRLTEPFRLDGVLDESVYETNEPFGGFVQAAPLAGAPSTERTDVWIMYDDENLYVTCRCWDEAPPGLWIVNELRRDTPGLRNNEHFGIMLDTFYDRRSGSMFYANPLGGRSDYAVVDEGGPNTDWNPVWDVVSGRFDGGWTLEMAIPFKSLRYQTGPDPLWGLQMRRSIRHKNEWAYLNPVPAFLAGPQALNRVSAGGTLVGLELPPAGNNLEVKPYALAGLSTNRVSTPAIDNDGTADVGLDLKYGITANLTADLTVNTDFAQVEVDEQQVNLTRFSLFFPEKR
ncbi:MAG: carbohydrate binding family 9 domain-containing protein, partial [Gemmatimonadetes bacterium]|nr:carbohydrate binding family 9 domain-containing protein [Gemmatimonadota bacterium]